QTWPANSVDTFVESSFSHEIFSYGEVPFQISRVNQLRANIFQALKLGGTYALRDFVKPNWPETVRLELPTTPRNGAAPFGNLSLTELFLDFAKTDFPGGIQFQEIPSTRAGYRSFEVSAD